MFRHPHPTCHYGDCRQTQYFGGPYCEGHRFSPDPKPVCINCEECEEHRASLAAQAPVFTGDYGCDHHNHPGRVHLCQNPDHESWFNGTWTMKDRPSVSFTRPTEITFDPALAEQQALVETLRKQNLELANEAASLRSADRYDRGEFTRLREEVTSLIDIKETQRKALDWQAGALRTAEAQVSDLQEALAECQGAEKSAWDLCRHYYDKWRARDSVATNPSSRTFWLLAALLTAVRL